ncbi:AAA family ATPase [Candidatus Woesearchaeota archaeon]|nr:AAA family ATPase [Candidatus Woesearchaeota archaeon]
MDLRNISFPSIVGLTDVKKQLASALLLKRHAVLVGGPGMGKTTMVRDIAVLLGEQTLNACGFHCKPEAPVCPHCKATQETVPTQTFTGQELFVRVQGSPDLTVEDLIGDIDPIKAMEFGPLSPQAFSPGKIFKANNGILFFDELNRCSQRLQNALLQVLEEQKVTIGSFDVDIAVDFVFIGTMNPEDTNTEPLSDVLLDRFDLIYVHYPDTQRDEETIVRKQGKTLLTFPDNLFSGMIKFLRDMRVNENLERVPSVRASIGLYERSQAIAQLNGRETVKPLDIMESLTSVLAHRIKLKPSVAYLKQPVDFLRDEFNQYCEENGFSLAGDEVP